MTIEQTLAGVRIDRLDAELLLSHVLGKHRTWLIAHADATIKPIDLARFETLIDRRIAHEPVAHIVGEQEFYGRSFIVTRDVLIPRPATEGVVDAALAMLKGERTDRVSDADAGIAVLSRAFGVPSAAHVIVDVGTGSGCIAITLALEVPHGRALAVDTSAHALDLCRANARRHGATKNIDQQHGDGIALVKRLREPFLIVSNPPYIPRRLKGTLHPSVVNYEPHEALFGGEDGLDVLRPLMLAAHGNPLCSGIVVECREDQVASLDCILT